MTDMSISGRALPAGHAGPPWMWMLVYGVLLCWPMLVTTLPLVYFDTVAYWSVGSDIMRFLIPPPPVEGAVATDAGGDAVTVGRNLRSTVYSLFFYVGSSSPIGLPLVPILQSWMTGLVAIFCLPQWAPDRTKAVIGAALLGVLTTLPWYASYAMPDILAALLILFYLLLVRRIDTMPWMARLLVLGLACFAVLAHYGHQPLVVGLAICVLAWRLWTRRLSLLVAAFCVLPIMVPMAINFTSSAVVLKQGSVAPKRLPILLARSIGDGPASWYLQDACEQDLHAICDLFDEVPTNIGVFLWSDRGIRNATPDQMDAIRAEEHEILIAAFRAYPVAQLRSLFGNAALQTVLVGTGELLPRPENALIENIGEWPLEPKAADGYAALRIADVVSPVATGLSLLALVALLVTGRLDRPQREAFALILLGLLINAAIFGGLSAPVDRYQSRIAWLLPALLVTVWAYGRGPKQPAI